MLLSARDHAQAVAAAAAAGEAGDLRGLAVDLDVTDRQAVSRAASAIGDDFGRLDVLVNNAAAYVDWSETATTADLERSRAVLDANLYGAWTVSRA